jgi:Sigma 54 modulation protein / S30EA ribosomal protein
VLITGNNIEVTPALHDYVNKKVDKILEKLGGVVTKVVSAAHFFNLQATPTVRKYCIPVLYLQQVAAVALQQSRITACLHRTNSQYACNLVRMQAATKPREVRTTMRAFTTASEAS